MLLSKVSRCPMLVEKLLPRSCASKHQEKKMGNENNPLPTILKELIKFLRTLPYHFDASEYHSVWERDPTFRSLSGSDDDAPVTLFWVLPLNSSEGKWALFRWLTEDFYHQSKHAVWKDKGGNRTNSLQTCTRKKNQFGQIAAMLQQYMRSLLVIRQEVM